MDKAKEELLKEAEKRVAKYRAEVDLYKNELNKDGIRSSFNSAPMLYTQAAQNLQRAERYLKALKNDFQIESEQIVLEGTDQEISKYLKTHPGKYKLIKAKE